MSIKKTTLRNYARLIVRMGVNVQKGQEVIIRAEFDQPEFIRMVTEECYKAGAKKVTVDWQDQLTEKVHYKYQTAKTLGTLEDWEIEKLKLSVDRLPVMIYIM
ncbi:MAG: aminopeptidase, partial [Clostridia bacterium]|nr:aminopeptidase [Clostridia bacterium]